MNKFILSVATTLALAPLAASAQPNVLLIIADDMGLDASFCYQLGDQQAPMPNIEAMCASGMVFENAYAAPTCSPSRATIMSGQYGFRTGVGAPVSGDGRDALSVDTPTVFDAVNGVGYASTLIGKWHISGWRAGYDAPSQMGVSDYFGFYRGQTEDYFNWTAIEDGGEVQIDGYATTVLTDRAIDWIDAQDRPWFLWLAYNAPHTPFHLPPGDLHSFDDLTDDSAAVKRDPLPYYQAMLEALDSEIGRLTASMTPQERDNTVIMFVGDNGTPNQVARALYGDHGAKGTIHEGGTHVPLIVSGPGVQAGRTEAFVNTTDLYATIAGLAGASVGAVDSINFGDVLAGAAGSRSYVYVEHFTTSSKRGRSVYGWALREGAHKLVKPEGEAAELYDLVSDPQERTNLLANGTSDEEAALVASLTARYDEIRSQ